MRPTRGKGAVRQRDLMLIHASSISWVMLITSIPRAQHCEKNSWEPSNRISQIATLGKRFANTDIGTSVVATPNPTTAPAFKASRRDNIWLMVCFIFRRREIWPVRRGRYPKFLSAERMAFPNVRFGPLVRCSQHSSLCDPSVPPCPYQSSIPAVAFQDAQCPVRDNDCTISGKPVRPLYPRFLRRKLAKNRQ